MPTARRSTPTTHAADKHSKTTKSTARSGAAKDTAARSGVRAKAGAQTRPAAAPRPSGYTVTIPVDQMVGAATTVVKAPLVAARQIAPVAKGLPVYLGLGGLAAIGVMEWPVAAAAGVGFAAMRRWGPLRDAPHSHGGHPGPQTQNVTVEEDGKAEKP